jgi:hypothetical protein
LCTVICHLKPATDIGGVIFKQTQWSIAMTMNRYHQPANRRVGVLRNDDLFLIDLHNGTDGLPSGVADWVSTLALLAGPDALDNNERLLYAAFAREHGGDLFDPLTLLGWRKLQGLRTTDEELRWTSAVEAVTQGRTPFLNLVQMHDRMQAAKGSCPLCGITPEFQEKGAEQPDMHRVLACYHFRYQFLPSKGRVRKPESWNASRWPFRDGIRISNDRGMPLDSVVATVDHSTHQH